MSTKALPLGTTFADVSKAFNLQPSFTPRLQDLERLKRGDFVRIMVMFRPDTPSEMNPKPANYETLTCLVVDKNPPGHPPLVALKIQTSPAFTVKHGLEFGDTITVQEQHILWHESATAEQVKQVEHLLTGVIPEAQPVNEEDRKLREVIKNLPPLAPEAGKRYWTRNGLSVMVWAFLEDQGCFVGGVAPNDLLRWNRDGTSQVKRDFDIVKDPTANEVMR